MARKMTVELNLHLIVLKNIHSFIHQYESIKSIFCDILFFSNGQHSP